jgi:hypothetical protein
LRLLVGLVAVALTVVVSAQESAVARVRAWRTQHEPQILRELFTDVLQVRRLVCRS